MTKWKTKRDLPILWVLILTILWIRISSSNSQIPVYFFGKKVEAEVIEFNDKLFYYQFKIKGNTYKGQAKQGVKNRVNTLSKLNILVYQKYPPIQLDLGRLKRVYASFIVIILFLLIPISITLIIIIRQIRKKD